MKITFDRILTVILIGLIGMYLLRSYRNRPSMVNGELAPTFSSQLKDGSNFDLAQLKGNYVLLDFWGSWCAPCRRQNPGLVKLYEEFHEGDFFGGANFEIVSIGIEQSERNWHAAIEKDDLKWPFHIMDTSGGGDQTFSGPVSSLYDIRSVPTSYLLDPKGTIIAVNAAHGQIRRLLNKRLEKE